MVLLNYYLTVLTRNRRMDSPEQMRGNDQSDCRTLGGSEFRSYFRRL